MDATFIYTVDDAMRRRVLVVAWSASRLLGGWTGYAIGGVMAMSVAVGASFAAARADPMLLLHPVVLIPGIVAVMFLGKALWLRVLLAVASRSGRDIQATCRVTDDQIRVEWDRGLVVIPWSDVRRVVRDDQVWFVTPRKGRSVFLPAGAVTDEVGGFIVQKVRAAGGKVK
jgi:hypothetical protein